jgi:acetyl-CoA synthetase
MLERRDTYDALYRDFRWQIPQKFNIGTAVSDRWAAVDPDRTALLDYRIDGAAEELSFGELSRRSNAFANSLRARGVRRGDRVALLLPQGFETAIAHVAIYKLGAIAVPLALLFGVEALEYRLQTAGVRAIVTNGAGMDKVARIASRLPTLDLLVTTEGPSVGAVEFQRLLRAPAPDFRAVDTTPHDPAMMIFTSGTTGPPKGALHGHRVLLGHLPGISMAHEYLPQPGDRLWTPGRLGVGGRVAQRAAAGPLFRDARWSSAVRQVRPRGGAAADGGGGGPQRVHSADGAADAEGGP